MPQLLLLHNPVLHLLLVLRLLVAPVPSPASAQTTQAQPTNNKPQIPTH